MTAFSVFFERFLPIEKRKLTVLTHSHQILPERNGFGQGNESHHMYLVDVNERSKGG